MPAAYAPVIHPCGAAIRCSQPEMKNIKCQFAVGSGQNPGHLMNFINIFPRKGVDKNRPRIVLIIFDLLLQQIFGFSDAPAGLIIAPNGNMNFIADRLRYFLKPLVAMQPNGIFRWQTSNSSGTSEGSAPAKTT